MVRIPTQKKKRAFSLIELMVVILILAILIVMGIGMFRRYRATTALRTAIEKIVNDVQSTTRQLARSSGCPHLGVTRSTASNSAVGTTLCGRILRKRAGVVAEALETFTLGDEGGTGSALTITDVTRLPLIDYSPLTAQGLALEIGQGRGGNFVQLFCIPIEPDGTLYTDPTQTTGVKTGSFIISNGYSKSLIEISPNGTVKVTDNLP